MQCDKPPTDWYCTREHGHEGPCAAWPVVNEEPIPLVLAPVMKGSNYEIKKPVLGPTKLCPETYMPGRELIIKVDLKFDPQHDGRPWPKKMVEDRNEILVNQIMAGLRTYVEAAVQKVRPFSIHGPT